MPVKNYISFGDTLIGEREVGATRRNYGVDALGSVTSTIQGSAIENTYAYKPYGEQLQKTGVATDPKFMWVGSLGYRSALTQIAHAYVRSRHYSVANARWLTVDPSWPDQPAYEYAAGRALVASDPDGLKAKLSTHPLNETPTCSCPIINWEWDVLWKLSPKPDGFIVQYVVVKYDHIPCPKNVEPAIHSNMPLYEGWEVKNHTIWDGYAFRKKKPGHDRRAMDKFDEKGFHGTAVLTFKAAFYEPSHKRDKNSSDFDPRRLEGWVERKGVKPGDNLKPSILVGLDVPNKWRPIFWDHPDSNYVEAKRTIKWNCCKGKGTCNIEKG